MLVLGLNGSPRHKGNTAYLLNAFLAEAARYGVRTRMVSVDRRNVIPCKEYTVCETRGTCPIEDDMAHEIYGLIRQAEVVVTASPIFFYNMTAQLKALVDRCQLFWARKYRLKLKDPLAGTRKGYLLGVAATRGEHLFEPMELSTKYFYDAISAKWAGALYYRGMEGATDLKKHPGVSEDVAREVKKLIAPLARRKRVLFIGRANAGPSQMAAAWARELFGETVMAASAGIRPAESVDPALEKTMAQRGLDLQFAVPRELSAVLEEFRPELVVAMEPGLRLPPAINSRVITWSGSAPSAGRGTHLNSLRDRIEKKVVKLLSAS